MAEENKEKIKKLELDLKTAFKDEKFDEVKKLAEELKALDPENHLAERLLEKMKKKEEEALKTANTEKIKDLEKQLKEALKEGHVPHVKTLMDEIKKLDPKNKAIKNAQAQLDQEKAKLESQANEEKVKGLTAEIKELLKNEELDKVKEKANELLKVDEKNSFALKTLKKITREKEVKAQAKAPKPSKEKKPGFFAGLFKKKEEAPKKVKKEVVKEKEVKPKAPPKIPAALKAEVIKPKPMPPTPPKVEIPKPKPAPPMPKVEVAKHEPEKKAEPPAKPEVKPMAVPPPVVAKPAPEKPVPAKIKPEKKEVVEAKPPKEKAAEKGNIFTKLFGKKEEIEKPAESIIETIVAKTEEVEKAKEKEKKVSTGEGFLKFASVLLKFSVAFILISAGFFYVQNVDEENRVLSLVGIEENYASRLHAAYQTLEEKKEEEKSLSEEIERYKKGYEDENIQTINKIIESRLDWNDLIRKLNEVTEFVYERNVLAQYVQYNNYSYDVSKGQLTVNGTLSDPLGKNLTKLAELEEAFRYYPRDKDDPTDQRKPYFFGLQEFRTFSKTFNKTTGRYQSNFSLTLYTKELEE